MEADWILSIGLVLTAALIAMACLLFMAAMQSRAPAAASVFGSRLAETVFIFDGEALVDATPPARALIANGVESGGPWFRALSRLEPMFPGLHTRLEGLQREGRFVLCSREDVSPPLVLRAEYIGGLTRLTLVDGDGEAASPGSDGLAELALKDELAHLHDTLARAPLPVWRETAEGEVIWANGPYLAAAAEQLEPGKELTWPLPIIFPQVAAQADNSAISQPHSAKDALSRPRPAPAATRASLTLGETTCWYDIQSRPLAGRGPGSGRLCYALPADGLVAAENSLHEFTQTLAKTFAQLPIGLAIFDKTRVLQMFNPALLDLTGLPIEFLIARPSLPAMLDTLRETSMLPEPKDYRSWRRQMAEMEKAAAEGLFEETWALPSGHTWRVTGRPHPNGALAFMVEDISTEMTRTRRYRADLELGQAVIDGLPDAVVVFAQDGSVALANAAATRLWGQNPLAGSDGSPGGKAIHRWREKTAPTLLWGDLEQFIGLFGTREAWDGELRMLDGRLLSCRVAPMPHGATLVTFRTAEPPALSDGSEEGGRAMLIA
ncbi:PAS domain-containing protein [Xinfangfangia sp. D13-10-4-6]|uniref:PAS-domain containing protein n=1 Tax=Pseudogemmobacter hezensis TaxID=2737662 RepID=UPI0015560E6A|nr:PAS-domain containing protein [Pseudogemmobacter hezensis]NPD14291.1 PAS domain-containing protein [Pseudogemmobacter hezensis]